MTIARDLESGPVLPENFVEFYRKNGYLVVENGLSGEEVETLRRETTRICSGEAGEIINAGNFAPDSVEDEILRRYLCIHFPHKISEIMFEALKQPTIVRVLQEIIGPNVKCMQSMLFIKASGKPGQAWHQDEYFIPTRDRSLTGAWMALDDATTENGCLWVLPGSHKRGIIYPQREHNDPRFDCTAESYLFPYNDSEAVPVEVKVGAIVFFNGYLLHRSLPNRAKSGYRRVLVNHYMSAESLLPWRKPAEGEAMGYADFRDIVMVAGSDPYAYKGTTDVFKPFIRPSGEGGCESQPGSTKKSMS
jgi:ectoine hydroxylase-related dioxygenase (phytanoyl-CoA dioxygenase family)